MKRFSLLLFMVVLISICLPANSWAKMSDEDFLELCEKGTFEQVQKALKNGANANAADEWRTTALHVAIWNNSDHRVVKLLLESGANPEAENSNANTPLIAAAMNRNPEVAKMLIKAGSKVNNGNVWGETPLHVASQYRNLVVLKMLLKAGADVNADDGEGKTALHYGLGEDPDSATIMTLLEAGANVNALDGEGKRPIDYVSDNESFKKTEAYKKLKELSAALIEPKFQIINKNEKQRESLKRFYNEYIKITRKLEEIFEKGSWVMKFDVWYGFFIFFEGYFRNTDGHIRKITIEFRARFFEANNHYEITSIRHFFDREDFFTNGLPAWLEYELMN